MGLFTGLVATAASYLGLAAYVRRAKLPSAAVLSFEEACLRAGYPVQSYIVPTKDGYLLRLFRIQKKGSTFQSGKQPVLMVHGLTHTSHAFIVAQNAKAPAFQLADTDFDVWLANTRGNHLSKMHLTLDTASREFWDYSAQDLAEKDLPAIIDFVLNASQTQSLKYVGHSQGTYLLMHLLAYMPEYNQKVDVGVLLTPFSGLFHPSASYLRLFMNPWMHKYLDYRNCYSIFSNPSATGIAKFLVRFPSLSVRLTKERYDISLSNDKQEVIPIYTQRLIGGTSVKNMKFWSQVVAAQNPRTRKFDYGAEKNRVVYGSPAPPQIEFEKIKVPLAIFGGKHDMIAKEKDIEVLRMQLTREQVVFYKTDYNLDHFGFACSNDMSYVSDMIKVLQTPHPKPS